MNGYLSKIKDFSGKNTSRSLSVIAVSAFILFSVATQAVSASAGSASAIPQVSATPGHRSAVNVRNYNNKTQQINGASGSNSTAYYYNWSGYAATSNTPYLKVQSTFVQPKVTCPVPGAWTLFWVGFDGFTNGTVEQAGTAAQCSTGTNPQPVYYAWWEMYPTNNIQVMPITIRVGDTVQTSVTYTASNRQYAMNVTDLSYSSQRYTRVATCAYGLTCARQSAEWIVERPTVNGAYAPLANWSTMSVGADQAANTSTTDRRTRVVSPIMQPASAFNNTPINMVNYPYTGLNLAVVGSLNTSGTSSNFADTWQATQ